MTYEYEMFIIEYLVNHPERICIKVRGIYADPEGSGICTRKNDSMNPVFILQPVVGSLYRKK